MPGYVRRHWQGDLPLAVAWWLNGIALTALSLAIPRQEWFVASVGTIDAAGEFTAFLLVGLFAMLLVPAWQVIGLYRAGDRHIATVGTILAGRLVQSGTTVLALLLALRFLIFAAEAYSGARIAYPIGPDARIVPSHGGRVLDVDAGFRFGLAAQVEAALDRNPRVRRLRLTSGGGALSEAVKLRKLILERQLDTEATSLCASACVSAFIAGKQRLLHRRARIGLHLPRNTGFGLRGPVSPFYAAELVYFSQRGVPDWFLDRWIATGRTFWYPAPSQLREAGLVTAFVGRPRPADEVYYR
jgi:hypothetical protein